MVLADIALVMYSMYLYTQLKIVPQNTLFAFVLSNICFKLQCPVVLENDFKIKFAFPVTTTVLGPESHRQGREV